MTEVTVFQTGFRLDDSLLKPGDIFRKGDNTLWKVNPDNSQSALGGGGSQPIKVVRIPIAYNTPGIVATQLTLPITAVDDMAQTFTVAGDHSDALKNASFKVAGSTGNDGTYSSGTTTFGAGSTVVTVQSVPPSAVADGNILLGTGGIVIYTPTPGEIIQPSSVTPIISTAWNGATPNFYLFSQGVAYTNGNNDFEHASLAGIPSSFGPHALNLNLVLNASILLSDATPVMAVIDDNSGGDPGSTMGAAEIVLLILAAP